MSKTPKGAIKETSKFAKVLIYLMLSFLALLIIVPVAWVFTVSYTHLQIEEQMMYNTYNMGIGMIVAVDPADVETAMEAMRKAGDTPYVIGSIEAGEKGVTLC